MRLEKTVAVLKLARALAGSAEGMTLDEMAAAARVSRRTVERMRDAVEGVFGPLEWIDDGRMKRFRIAARGLGNFVVAPTYEELAELENAARACDAVRDGGRAAVLRSLDHKIHASLRDADRRRLSTDVEALLRAEAFARQVGPRPLVNPHVLSILREALLAQKVVRFSYGDDTSSRPRTVVPYGILFAPRYYFVGSVSSKPDPVLFRLDRIHDITVTDEFGAPPEAFDLQEYSSRSFGVFQEEPEDVVLRFDPSAARDARAYLFHPTQTMTDESDGALIVRFQAGGLLQIAHHLMK
jgi:predicted DNA-binding transcriptional regulator YafY